MKNQLQNWRWMNPERCKVVIQIETWCIPFNLFIDTAINRVNEFTKLLNGRFMGVFQGLHEVVDGW